MQNHVSSSDISAEEMALVDKLKEMVLKKTLSNEQKAWLTDITYARFIRARNQNVDKAYKMISSTLDWRAKRKPETVKCLVCPKNPYSHSLRAIGVDRIGRPVFYSSFHVDNRNAEDNIVHLIHLLENVFELGCVSEQNYVWLMDFSGFSAADLNPSFSIQAMKMFQSHYPERMGKVLVFDAPKSFQKLYRILRPVIDENTKKKVTFMNVKADHDYPEFKELFDDALSERLVSEVKITRDEGKHEFWVMKPVPPMVDMGIHKPS